MIITAGCAYSDGRPMRSGELDAEVRPVLNSSLTADSNGVSTIPGATVQTRMP
ncbi:hypothetical protein J2X46_004064 [Nocardioides sp. BE266]|nr:hypothetical protein [Nocardioides sp. BE266]